MQRPKLQMLHRIWNVGLREISRSKNRWQSDGWRQRNHASCFISHMVRNEITEHVMPAVHSCWENPRARMEMETLASPQMLSCSLGRSCRASLPLIFLVVCNVRVKGSRVTHQNHIHSRTHTRLNFQIFFPTRIPGYFGVRKRASADYLIENYWKI